MKRNKFIDFIISMEEEDVPLGKYYVKKKFVLIGVLAIIVYLSITLYNANSPKIIRELLRSQNMYLSDEDIAKFREDVRKNMPKTQEEAMKNAEEFKNFEETTMKQVYEEAKKMAEEETKKKGE